MYTTNQIHNNKKLFFEYLKFCNQFKGKTLGFLIGKINDFRNDFNYECESINIKDKGLLGKFTKTVICGLNTKQNLTFDEKIFRIRTINLSERSNNTLFVKERLTLDNIGTNENNSFEKFTEKEFFKYTNIYNKIRKNIIFKYQHKKFKTKEDFLDIKFLGSFYCDINELPQLYLNQIEKDFRNIKKEINDKTFSSINQKYLHIQKHGNKNSTTRAIGFKNEFVLILVKYAFIQENIDKIINGKCNIKFRENNLNFEIDNLEILLS